MDDNLFTEEQKETVYIINGVEIKESELPKEYKEGDVFTSVYPPSAAMWANETRNHYISEIDKDADGNRCFKMMRVPDPTLNEVRTRAISRVDAHTSATILAGFDYTVAGEVLHFSYDSFDQANFNQTANIATLALQGVEGIPTSVTWNAYRNYTKETGGELVRIEFTAQEFLALYVAGASNNKATVMEIGGQRKEALNACTSIEEINNLLEEWAI